MKRIEKHNGALVLASAAAHLTPQERAEVPERLVHLVEHWRDVWQALPVAFAWAHGTLQGMQPLLERAVLDGGRLQWSVRLPLYGDVKRLEAPCFSCRETAAVANSLPAELAWLAATFGDCFIETQCSGTAPWGVRLESVRDRMFEGVFDQLPPEAAEWVVLYEADGDWLCADLVSGKAHWTGMEWTGEPDVGYPSWRTVMHFVLWRMFDGGWVRPTDLDMLFAGRLP